MWCCRCRCRCCYLSLCMSVCVCISITKFTHHLQQEFYDWHMMAHNIVFQTLPPSSLSIVSSFSFFPFKRRLKNGNGKKKPAEKKNGCIVILSFVLWVCITKLSAKLPYKWWHQKLFGYVIGNHTDTNTHSINFSSVVEFFKLTDRMKTNKRKIIIDVFWVYARNEEHCASHCYGVDITVQKRENQMLFSFAFPHFQCVRARKPTR